MAKVIEAESPELAWATMKWRTLTNVFLVGLLVGIVTYALYTLLERFVFEPILCREAQAMAQCGSEGSFASAIAIILGSMVGLVFMVRERILRPLLVILAVGLSLWGFFGLAIELPWLVTMMVTTLTFGVAYAVFAWLAQPVSLVVGLTAVTVVVVAVRLVLTI